MARRNDGRGKNSPATKRVTRAQSVEAATPKRTKRSRPTSTISNSTPQSARKRARPPKASGGADDGLETVEENAPSEDDQQDDDAESQQDDDDAQEAETTHAVGRNRASYLSGISGTTAKTSSSHDEVDQLDTDDLLDTLPNLASASDDLAKVLAPDGKHTTMETWKQIRTTGSRPNKTYNNRIASRAVHKPKFGSHEYIQPRNILRAILGVQSLNQLPPAAWRPDDILFRVNLVQMLNSLVIISNPNDWAPSRIDALENLVSAFPAAIAGSEYSLSAVEFYVDIATQLSIARLDGRVRSDPRFSSPHSVIHEVFYGEHDVLNYAHDLGLADDRPDRYHAFAVVQSREAALEGHFGAGESILAGIDDLKTEFPWDAFASHALHYFDDRSKSLAARIDAAGGVPIIAQALSQESERRANSPYSQMFRRMSKPESTPRQSFNTNVMRALKQQEREMIHEAPPAPEAPVLPYPTLRAGPQDGHSDVVYIPPDDDNDDGVESRHPANSAPIETNPIRAMRPAQSSPIVPQPIHPRTAVPRSKSLLDRQENAERVRWEDTQTQQPTSSAFRNPGSSLGKRPHAYVEEDDEYAEAPDPTQDPSQDDGEFQVDPRYHNPAPQRRRALPPGRPTVPAAVPTSPVHRNVVVPTGTNLAGSTARSPPSMRASANPGASIAPPTQIRAIEDNGEPASSRFARARVLAQHNRINASQNREPMARARTRWDDVEEDALLTLIEENGGGGISYTALKRVDQGSGNKLRLRTSEDIRFKARNMKVTYLRAGLPLPLNWEHVMLDRKALRLLEDHGILIDQEAIRHRREEAVE